MRAECAGAACQRDKERRVKPKPWENYRWLRATARPPSRSHPVAASTQFP